MLGTTLGLMRTAIPALAALPLALGLAMPVPQAAAQSAAEQEQEQQPLQEGSQTPFRPVAVVNGSAITGFDLIQRAQIMLALGFEPQSEQELRSQALDRLIQDRVKFQEARRLGLEVSDEEIRAGIAELAEGVGMDPNDMVAQLAAQDVSQRALEDLVAADVVWRKVVRVRFSGQVEPSESEVDAQIARLGQRSGVAYRVGEIGLPLETEDRTPAETRELAERLSRQLDSGGDFAAAVRRYSQSVSAAEGGEVGWVSSANLPPEVAEALAGLEPGDVTRPVEVEGGLSILKVFDRREAAGGRIDPDDPQVREQVRNRLMGQQGQRLAQGLLQELRRDALIEIR